MGEITVIDANVEIRLRMCSGAYRLISAKTLTASPVGLERLFGVIGSTLESALESGWMVGFPQIGDEFETLTVLGHTSDEVRFIVKRYRYDGRDDSDGTVFGVTKEDLRRIGAAREYLLRL